MYKYTYVYSVRFEDGPQLWRAEAPAWRENFTIDAGDRVANVIVVARARIFRLFRARLAALIID